MAITDQAILSVVQSLAVEPIDGGLTWPSNMWTQAEVLRYLDDAQQDMVAATSCILKRAPALPCVAGNLQQDLPEDFLQILRLVWVRASDARRFTLHKADVWQLDAALGTGIGNWRVAPGVPTYYTVADQPTRTVQLAPAPSVAGTLALTYLAVPTAFDGSGVTADVPDEATVGLVWKTLAHMLIKEGRAKDAARAEVAEQRGRLIEEAVKLLLMGWEA